MVKGPSTQQLITDLHRTEWGRLLAALIRDVHDIELAEDALQDAFGTALGHWAEHGVPSFPVAWLHRAARNQAVDRIRRQDVFGRKRAELEARAQLLEIEVSEDDDRAVEDHRLLLMFTCCHPALANRDQVALTLQTLGGLTTKEIARAYLTAETTLAQRLVRTKKKIKTAGIPYQEPTADQLPQRMGAILSVIYLIFNEGYAAGSGSSPFRAGLVEEAIKLGKTLARLSPRDPEVAGLLALMLLHDSRRQARFLKQRPVPIDRQDRSLWNQEEIRSGTAILESALRLGRPGPYQIQAAISAVHAEASTESETDWAQIALLYQRLYELTRSPVVKLNGAVAVSFADGPEAGLEILDQIAANEHLQTYQPFHAARADFHRRAGQKPEAIAAYLQAISMTENQADRLFLNDRLVELGSHGSEAPKRSLE